MSCMQIKLCEVLVIKNSNTFGNVRTTVAIAQVVEHRQLKSEAPGSIPGSCQFFTVLSSFHHVHAVLHVYYFWPSLVYNNNMHIHGTLYRYMYMYMIKGLGIF